MPSVVSPVITHDLSGWAGFRYGAVHFLHLAMEAILLVLVCLSPWAFGAVEPIFEFLLDAGVALLLSLWAARMLLEWQLSWQKCPVALCLATLFLLGIWQVTPLPKPLLGWLSPATVQLYDQLLPSQPEVLPFGEQREATVPRAGSTISLYPGATRQQMLRLLAVFLLFAIVRNNTAAAASLRRLSIAALVNGVLLSLFGLIQFFSSPHNTVYWNFPTRGQVFGPFINRNHFALYINLCIGLGIGLFLSSTRSRLGGPGTLFGRRPATSEVDRL